MRTVTAKYREQTHPPKMIRIRSGLILRDSFRALYIALFLLLSQLFLEAKDSPKLNSERIAARFGSYGIRVIEHEPRVSVLFSRHDGVEICRTLAIVEFTRPIPDPLKSPISKVIAGGSLGATLKEAGWRISKRFLHHDTLTAGPRFIRLAHLEQAAPLAVSIYELIVSRGGNTLPVATLVEIYHPDYLNLTNLKALQPQTANSDRQVNRLLQLAREKMKEEPE